MAADFGTDVSTFVLNDDGELDLDPYFRKISGNRVVAEAVARRWTMSKGSMFWDADAGEDIREKLKAKLDEATIEEMQASLAGEAMKDERVLTATVLVTFDVSRQKLRIRCSIVTAQGPFEFVMGISTVTAEVLGLEVIE